ncbi:TlpA family protein disulfide reductase [aff. Roholtiella sp. LEGE 12411]|uniref:TlpA family protein disulfide reductase n=1 Tax=aff. Roholtiella sp. LEGE 12411 TaxID=1828822 RepID=UPI00187FD129|nr:thioredoxin family protein [aff. Roholtiella sp. LEGE 12411]MBE9038833.1 thioredoxin family protein [aff. Roholtiella sp. LEGE 12411]
MYKNKFFLSLLCLSGLILTVSCSPTKSDNISQNQAPSTTNVAQSNPCAAKNPCAGKDAAKLTSVGNPLAQELQGKPVLVDVFATWCAGCKNIAPTLSQLKQEYSSKVNFVVLDVTDKAKLQETQAQAEKLGLGKFLEANKSKTSTVVIVDPATGKILTIFKNNPNKADYTKILDTALAKS